MKVCQVITVHPFTHRNTVSSDLLAVQHSYAYGHLIIVGLATLNGRGIMGIKSF